MTELMSPAEIAAIVADLKDGVHSMGMHEDNSTELFDIDGANERMFVGSVMLKALQAQLAAMTEARDAAVARVKHRKRGTTYRVIGAAKLQTDKPLSDYADLTVYQCETDGMIWVRPTDEFEDGRFEAITTEGTPT